MDSRSGYRPRDTFLGVHLAQPSIPSTHRHPNRDGEPMNVSVTTDKNPLLLAEATATYSWISEQVV
jgi:hypothetical protein